MAITYPGTRSLQDFINLGMSPADAEAFHNSLVGQWEQGNVNLLRKDRNDLEGIRGQRWDELTSGGWKPSAGFVDRGIADIDRRIASGNIYKKYPVIFPREKDSFLKDYLLPSLMIAGAGLGFAGMGAAGMGGFAAEGGAGALGAAEGLTAAEAGELANAGFLSEVGGGETIGVGSTFGAENFPNPTSVLSNSTEAGANTSVGNAFTGSSADAFGTGGGAITGENTLTGANTVFGSTGTPFADLAGLSEGTLGTVASGTPGVMDGISKFLKTLGLTPGDIGKAGLNYLIQSGIADKYNAAAQKAGEMGKSLNDPQRQPYQQQLSQLLSNPSQFWATNPVAQGQLNLAKQQFEANTGKMGTGGTQFNDYLKNVMNVGSGTFNDQANLLSTLGGFNQGAGYSGTNYAELAGKGIAQGQQASYFFPDIAKKIFNSDAVSGLFSSY